MAGEDLRREVCFRMVRVVVAAGGGAGSRTGQVLDGRAGIGLRPGVYVASISFRRGGAEPGCV